MPTGRWKGSRGEWYVLVQVVLMVLIAVGPRRCNGWPRWPFPSSRMLSIASVALPAAGAALVLGAMVEIGTALTPLPRPSDKAVLRQTGVYGVVRHPMYAGVLLAAFGWALFTKGWLTLGYVLASCVFIDLKVRREETWLLERFPDYAQYRRRVRKLIPFIY